MRDRRSGQAALTQAPQRVTDRWRRRGAVERVSHGDLGVRRADLTGLERTDEPLAQMPGQLEQRLDHAVDRNYAGLGVGTALTAHVLATAVELNAKAACRAVVVTAVDETACSWWERLGFRPFHADPPTSSTSTCSGRTLRRIR
ncbi:MAG: GNAT family N-acetyltransferase [Solirubrobacteraceae bacterium]